MIDLAERSRDLFIVDVHCSLRLNISSEYNDFDFNSFRKKNFKLFHI